uniref:Uncharacterized protein n=1 Tax=Arundo donax TaxID=35708 RepID=A0A0A9BXP6_ARUDO
MVPGLIYCRKFISQLINSKGFNTVIHQRKSTTL